MDRSPFYWQDDYSVFSFGGKQLPFVINYVERQKEHHKQKTILTALERVSGDSERPLTLIRENNAIYLTGVEAWREEMMQLD